MYISKLAILNSNYDYNYPYMSDEFYTNDVRDLFDDSKILNFTTGEFTRQKGKSVNLRNYISWNNNYMTTSNEAVNLAIRLNTYFEKKNLEKFMKNRLLFVGSFHGKDKVGHKYFKLRPGEQVIMNCAKSWLPSMKTPRLNLFKKLKDQRTTKISFMKWITDKSRIKNIDNENINYTNTNYTPVEMFRQMCVFDDKIPNVALFRARSGDTGGLLIGGKNPQGIFQVPLKFSKDKKILTSFRAFSKTKEYPIDLHQIIRLLRKHNYKKFTLFITFCR